MPPAARSGSTLGRMGERVKGKDGASRLEAVADAFLAAAKNQRGTPQAPLGTFSRLGRGGCFVVGTAEEIAALDVAVAPPMELYPHLYEPALLGDIALGALGRDHGGVAALERVASAGGASLYMIPKAATDALAELTPARLEHTKARIAEITDRLMRSPNLPAKTQRNGAATAVVTLRGHCLEAREAEGREVYYWFWRRSDAAG